LSSSSPIARCSGYPRDQDDGVWVGGTAVDVGTGVFVGVVVGVGDGVCVGGTVVAVGSAVDVDVAEGFGEEVWVGVWVGA
jgi:hypothetical protein